jgi:type I restriction-modification system DNA methylase subunit
MKKGYEIQIGKKTWKELEQLRNHGYSNFFIDWLDLILNSLLALTENHSALCSTLKLEELNKGKYNERYMQIVKKYGEGKIGERAIDHMANAFRFLIQETEESQKDVIGEIFQAQITYGENGQFFTPEHITDFMAKIAIEDDKKEVLNDPCCGSGRFLLSASKENKDMYLIGQDIDERCCKMTAINLFIRDLNGEVRLGNSLANKIQKRWIIQKGGFIFEDDQERELEKIKEKNIKEIQDTLNSYGELQNENKNYFLSHSR